MLIAVAQEASGFVKAGVIGKMLGYPAQNLQSSKAGLV
jgi:hypothetical protein